jgi:toxin ParE1/3/4
MTRYAVVFAPEFLDSLDAILSFMELRGASDAQVDRYQRAVLEFCESLSTFPNRGRARDDLAPGIRIINYRDNTILPYAVDESRLTVTFLGAYAARQDYAALIMDCAYSQ